MATWGGEHLLSTPRLVLRRFRADDLPLYAALNTDPEVVEFLGGPLTREDSDGIAEWAQDLHDAEGIGLLAVERRSDGAFLGMCGLHHLYPWYPDQVELGYRLARAYWGHGYATEAATAWLDHGFGARRSGGLGLDRVISVTDAPNVRSVAVMERLGMTFEEEVLLEDKDDEREGSAATAPFVAVIHSITAERWYTLRDRKD